MSTKNFTLVFPSLDPSDIKKTNETLFYRDNLRNYWPRRACSSRTKRKTILAAIPIILPASRRLLSTNLSPTITHQTARTGILSGTTASFQITVTPVGCSTVKRNWKKITVNGRRVGSVDGSVGVRWDRRPPIQNIARILWERERENAKLRRASSSP